MSFDYGLEFYLERKRLRNERIFRMVAFAVIVTTPGAASVIFESSQLLGGERHNPLGLLLQLLLLRDGAVGRFI